MKHIGAQPAKSEKKSLLVEIERILPGGVGLAHAEGLTLFVPFAAPGDQLRVRVDRVRGKVGFATIREIVSPSPVRVEPPCPYFGRCGGCDFQQLSYQAQLDSKVEIIRDCLHRIAHLETFPEIRVYPAEDPWQYRSRAVWQFDSTRGRLGYFEAGSHRVCDVEACPVLAPELEQLLKEVREQIRRGSLETVPAEIGVVAGDLASISVAPAFDDLVTAEVSRKIGTENYTYNAEAFFQINHSLLSSLIGAAVPSVAGRLAFDLYCGVGLFTLPLARRFERVVGIESNSVAARFARRNLKRAGLLNATITTDRVARSLQTEWNVEETIDILLLDPPRSGAEAGAMDEIVRLHPKQISYVSCDPATLARDLETLITGGYTLDSIAMFDMFPQTHHVETLVVLS
ncbi:MAG TPA: class I SAM-dependent RNA methyltransferase [Pyrinomonadaceae bacterium]|nr:class I SAM-dependent RNA methyltransferase [Pyrinomonadaceae bacterium]